MLVHVYGLSTCNGFIIRGVCTDLMQAERLAEKEESDMGDPEWFAAQVKSFKLNERGENK